MGNESKVNDGKMIMGKRGCKKKKDSGEKMKGCGGKGGEMEGGRGSPLIDNLHPLQRASGGHD